MNSMRLTTILLLVSFWCFPVHAQKEPKYLSPLASGYAPECPEHVGTRSFKSEVAKMGNAAIYVTGVSTRNNSGCQQRADLHIERDTVAHSHQLPDPDKQEYDIIDFSSDGSSFLLSTDRFLMYAKGDFRNVEITVVPIVTGETVWRNVWDIFQWHDCVATVEPQGFASDGSVVLQARPSVMYSRSLPNCVPDDALYSVNLERETVKRLSPEARISRYGSSVGAQCQTCKGDPDIVGACFTVHGRMAVYNGGPAYRIWRIGTDRILGLQDDIVPESIAANLTRENAAFGDFYVCPFTKQKPGEMQFICVESASKIIFGKW